ncbi:UPF0481 protein At3g47200-like [Bidens hawaiensis]|uniref:UPF0481 protein At3g47200-like n=1 Tax=Bidens hawaiensis TaxID=980011 RepID=UPI00404929FD
MPTQQDQTQGRNEVIDSITNSVTDASPRLATKRISKIPPMMREIHDYEKYFVPKVVSIGPYHYGNPKLELVEKLKPTFAMKLVKNNKEILEILYSKLEEPDTVRDLRGYYEENSTSMFSDMDFAKMMLLDSCFILYYIVYIFGRLPEDCRALNNHQIVFIHQDLFLLENQVPFKPLIMAMTLMDFSFHRKLTWLIEGNILTYGKPKRKWLKSILCIRNYRSFLDERDMELRGDNEPDHLLQLLHRTLTKLNDKVYKSDHYLRNNYRCTFRNVRELVDVGIHFKPSDTMSLARINVVKGGWWFSAAVELPPISVDDSTKPMLLNLIAYEMCSNDDAWVTSYVCLLDSLIQDPEDVTVLRKAGVLENSLGSDKEVVELFKKLGTDLVPNSLAYLEAKNKIQRHYESRSNALISQLKLFSLFGVTSLLLSAVQTYFTIWSLKSECDDLCKFLKKNHHL